MNSLFDKKVPPACDTCYHYVEDEDDGGYYCEVCDCIDEDENAVFVGTAGKQCPFYRYNDEYISVRKQI